MKRSIHVACGFILLGTAVCDEARAIPAFARKYHTSCQTCHVAYPKLNSYGQAFRLLGYRLPGETEEQIKQPEIPLGSDAYKRVWPKAVWPGAIPPSVPLSIAANFLWENASTAEGEDVENNFMFPQAVELIAGGTAGDHISYFGEIAFTREVEDGEMVNEVEVEHIDVRFIRPIKDSTAFNVKIGSFQPELVSTFDHARRLTIANYDAMFGVAVANPGGAEEVGGGDHHGGGGAIGLPAVAEGFEGFGVAKGRFFWAAGIVNGIGPGESSFDGNSNKDFYGRIAYKWGGLALDGSNAETYAGSSKNWREKSFQIGLFAYQGDGSDIFFGLDDHHDDGHGEEGEDDHGDAGEDEHGDEGEDDHGDAGEDEHGDEGEDDHGEEVLEPALVEDENFTRYGVDFQAYYNDLNIFGAYVRGEDDLRVFSADEEGAPGPIIPDESGTFDYTAWFIEANYVFPYPWLVGAARYESVDLPEASDWERATLSLTGLVRVNVKATLEYTWDLNESSNYFVWANLGIAF